MLAAVVEALVEDTKQRILRLLSLAEEAEVKVDREVVVAGRVGDVLGEALRSAWPGEWRFRHEPSATLRGLGRLWSA